MSFRRFEYDFVRLDGRRQDGYRQVIRERTEQGLRLVQVLAPGSGGLSARSDYIEVILERKAEV